MTPSIRFTLFFDIFGLDKSMLVLYAPFMSPVVVALFTSFNGGDLVITVASVVAFLGKAGGVLYTLEKCVVGILGALQASKEG